MISANTVRGRLKGLIPGREAVTLRSRGDGDAFTDYSTFAAKKGLGSDVDQSEPLMTPTLKARWQILQADLDAASAPAPKAGDVIRDGSDHDWFILSIETPLFELAHQCMTQRSG
jgi:hypothetical protein